ncbi:MAG: phosphoribosylglycinamide formyltransferase [Bacteroidales bacterium]|nr:phosphoribosylglycinamide formyltransferase [Candidatus Colimorpha onthohippi]
MIKLALFASGNGTNVQRISEYFANHSDIQVACVVYNKKDAYVAQRAKQLGIEARYFAKKDFYESNDVLDYVRQKGVDYIILAGFLLLVPDNFLQAFPSKIINIHPALLPKYGGKGMYGHHVHQAVVDNHETESGITIHVVDNHYDRGTTLFQAKCEVLPSDTPDDVAAKIHLLEQAHFPIVIEQYIMQNGAK